MRQSQLRALGNIEQFLQHVGVEKQASEAHTEPGSVGGPTSHPVKDVDDSTGPATEGFRSAENSADVKADQGSASVDSTPEDISKKKASLGKSQDGGINPPGTAREDQIQIGTTKAPTGEDPSVETGSTKNEKEDPASAPRGHVGHSTHPARTNNNELDGRKYASAPLSEHIKAANDAGNHLLALLAVAGEDADKQAGDKAAAEVDASAQAGWELAGLLTGDFDEKAASSVVEDELVGIIQKGETDATKVAAYLNQFQEAKIAMEGMGEEPPMPPGGMGGEPPMPPGGMGGEPPMPPGGMGGGPPMPPGGMGGGPEDGQDMEAILALLEQLGVSPEELMSALDGEGGGADLGGLGAAGAAPPPSLPPGGAGMGGDAMVADGEEAGPGMEVEATDHYATNSKEKAAASDKAVAEFIQELLQRSRR